MKNAILLSALATLPATLTAGESALEDARRPITNATLFDSALPQTSVHAIFMKQNLPGLINTQISPNTPLGGDFNLFAVQFEIALNDTTSIVATKDGYIDFNPSNTLTEEEGFANLAAGVKHAFYINDTKQEALSASIVAELPTGNRDVFQGNGDGAINLTLNGLKVVNQWQFNAAAGLRLPIDTDEEATSGFLSAHAGYNVTDKLYLLAEANWFRVLDSGEGNSNFQAQAGGAVPAVANFEGGDLINLGAANATLNKDIVTAAVGFRYKLCDKSDFGFAYEIPLTDKSDNLMEDRITLDFVYKF